MEASLHGPHKSGVQDKGMYLSIVQRGDLMPMYLNFINAYFTFTFSLLVLTSL